MQNKPPGTVNQGEKLAPGGIHLTPLLCLNTWEHVWLTDYGIDGKRRYVEAWWDRINWTVVSNAFQNPPTRGSGDGRGDGSGGLYLGGYGHG